MVRVSKESKEGSVISKKDVHVPGIPRCRQNIVFVMLLA